jgi:gamma-glutamyl:cysteine ligase YbdK (ATP-grasp superfamily)
VSTAAHAFTIATHDPDTAETALIAGRTFYARRFALAEVTAVSAAIQALLADVADANRPTVTRRQQIRAALAEPAITPAERADLTAELMALPELRQFTVRDEIKPVLKVLNTRVADGGKALTLDQALDALTEADYRTLLGHYAPSLLQSVSAGGSGN